MLIITRCGRFALLENREQFSIENTSSTLDHPADTRRGTGQRVDRAGPGYGCPAWAMELADAVEWMQSEAAQELGTTAELRALVDASRRELDRVQRRTRRLAVTLMMLLALSLALTLSPALGTDDQKPTVLWGLAMVGLTTVLGYMLTIYFKRR